MGIKNEQKYNCIDDGHAFRYCYAESTQLTPNFSPESVTVSTSAGTLSGKSHEMVYDTGTGRKVSQLD